MAPSNGLSKAQERAHDRIAAVRATSKTSRAKQPRTPDVYQELLSEAISSPDPGSNDERPLKKRRFARPGHKSTAAKSHQPVNGSGLAGTSEANSYHGDSDPHMPRPRQTVVDSDESEEDIDWEEIGFDQNAATQSSPAKAADDDIGDIGDISVEVGGSKTTPKKAAIKRKPATTAEKLHRLAVHEAHLLFLLFHVHVRNAWCNLPAVQSELRTLLSAKNIKFLNPPEEMAQFVRSRSFLDGLELAVDLWKTKFRVTESGMRRANWAESSEDLQAQITALHEGSDRIDKKGFIRAAKSLTGSQDIGNHLFCALLRSVGVDARLVCSLQPLPFGTSAVKSATPQKAKPTIYLDTESDRNSASSGGEGSATGSASEGSSSAKPRVFAPGRRRRIGKPTFAAEGGGSRPRPVAPKKKKIVRKLDYPVFWVEAFNPAYQKWVAIDAVVTGTVNKPAKLEPPASYDLNTMNYVVALEDDGVGKDVTRRYTKAYNAKTRKQRVESGEGGERWWKKALKVFRRKKVLDRDQVEDAELAKKEAAEGLPNNVQDFKDHPYYALERHLKRHEVIWPKREVGKINAGKSSSSNVESVYRRSDVQTVRSSDKWYRFGREMKPGEQPLKHVPARTQRGQNDDADSGTEGPAMTGLYAFSQTALYIPPPVVRGRIPKNAFGNLDVYVPSMVPPGGIHIRHQAAQKAARVLGIDYADAVTGFQFKGRHGTAITSGIVVAEEYREAVESVIEGFAYAQENEENEARSLECLRLWKRFLTGLRIGERIGLHAGGAGTSVKADALKKEMDAVENEQEKVEEGGGFFPDAGRGEAVPTSARMRPPMPPVVKTSSEEEGNIGIEAPRLRRKRKVALESDDDSGDEYNPGVPTVVNSDEHEEDIGMSAPRLRRKRKVASKSNNDTEDEYHPDPRPPARRGGTRGLLQEEEEQLYEATSAAKLADDSDGMSEDTRIKGSDVAEADHINADGFLVEDHDADTEDNTAMSGGGFMPEEAQDNTADYGGGFLPDEDGSTADETALRGGGFVAENTDEGFDISGGGFIPEEPDPADTSTMPAEGDGFINDAIEDDNVGTEADNENDESLNDMQEDEQIDDEDEESEKGSLMSHDPDDEDAEPEWLNSD